MRASSLSAWEKSFHRDRLSRDMLIGQILDGEACSPEQYRTSCRLAERCRVEFDDVFAEIDVLLTPSHPAKRGFVWPTLYRPCSTFLALHTSYVSLPGVFRPN